MFAVNLLPVIRAATGFQRWTRRRDLTDVPTEVLTGSGARSPDGKANRRSPANVKKLRFCGLLWLDLDWFRVMSYFLRAVSHWQEASRSGCKAAYQAAHVRCATLMSDCIYAAEDRR